MPATHPRKEQLTAAAAVAFVLSVGVVSALPSGHTPAVLILVLSAVSFVSLYATG